MAEVKMPNDLDLPSNSIVQPDKQIDTNSGRDRKVKKIAQGKVAKKGYGRKFADVFFGEEVVDVKGYILQDVLIPAIKDTISDVVTGGIEMLLFGERRGRGGRKQNGGSYTSYSSYYGGANSRNAGRSNETRSTGRNNGRYSIEDIILESRGEAEEVLDNMIDAIKDYGMVSVADMYDMVGITGAFTDNSWGWFDLSSATVRRVRDGYLLVLPRVQSLK